MDFHDKNQAARRNDADVKTVNSCMYSSLAAQKRKIDRRKADLTYKDLSTSAQSSLINGLAKMASSTGKKGGRQSTLAFRLINPELFIKPVGIIIQSIRFFIYFNI